MGNPYKAIFYANSVIDDVMNADIDTRMILVRKILGEAYSSCLYAF